jgi:hypothetical protein
MGNILAHVYFGLVTRLFAAGVQPIGKVFPQAVVVLEQASTVLGNPPTGLGLLSTPDV